MEILAHVTITSTVSITTVVMPAIVHEITIVMMLVHHFMMAVEKTQMVMSELNIVSMVFEIISMMYGY